MDLRLDGKVAVVTGGSRGIGLAIARRMVEAGADVLLTSRKSEVLEAAARDLRDAAPERSGQVAWFAAHAADPEQAEACIAMTMESFGHIDILVNNAGTNPYFGPLIGLDTARAQKTYELNQLAVVTWTAAAVHAGMGEGGSILNISSVGGIGPEPGLGWYNATKAAVIHLTRQLAYELAPAIRVNALAPGLVKTDLARALWEGNEASIGAHIPLRRLGEPDDIASAALFLSSDAASWITGQTLVVDGGTTNQPSGGVG